MSLVWKFHALTRNLLPRSTIRLWDSGERSVTDTKKGFYVDVGAYAPKQFSNTYAFYKKGWKGINIDASPGSMRIFDRVRKRDINIEAVSNKGGELLFYHWGFPNVTNTLSKEHAERCTELLGKEPELVKVRSYRLEDILDTYLPNGQSIDFFSIDVENHNLEVLESNNWTKYRPTFIIVELDAEKAGLKEIINSMVTAYLNAQHYHLCSWTELSLIFEHNKSEEL